MSDGRRDARLVDNVDSLRYYIDEVLNINPTFPQAVEMKRKLNSNEIY